MNVLQKLAIRLALAAVPIVGIHPQNAFAQSGSNKKLPKGRKGGKSVKNPNSDDDRYTEGVSLADDDSRSPSSAKYFLGTLGLSPQPLIGAGVSAGLTTASGNAWEASLTIGGGRRGDVAVRVIQAVGRYRLSMFGFAYTAYGGGFRNADGAWNVLNVVGVDYETGSSLNALTLDSAFGASTKLGSILIEADVLGVSYPILKFGGKKSTLNQDDVDRVDEAKQKKVFDSMSAGLYLTIMKVGVGISF